MCVERREIYLRGMTDGVGRWVKLYVDSGGCCGRFWYERGGCLWTNFLFGQTTGVGGTNGWVGLVIYVGWDEIKIFRSRNEKRFGTEICRGGTYNMIQCGDFFERVVEIGSECASLTRRGARKR